MLSISDELYTVLGEAGYTGTANDRVYKWLSETTGRTDLSINDMAMLLFKRIGYSGTISDIVNSKVPVPLTLLAQGLFINGEAGALYDLYDRSTIFQDAAGTTPWTTLGQPVGLILDKSKGLVLGSELRQTGAAAIIGSATAATYNTSTGEATCTRVDINNQSYIAVGSLNAGARYKMTVSNTGSVIVGVRQTLPGGTVLLNISPASTATLYFYGSATLAITCDTGSGAFTLSSVRELPGNHAYQTTAASRPTIEARVNLLTKSEQFDDAAWAKTAVTINANAVVAPDGTLTADRLTELAVNAQHYILQNAISGTGRATVSFYVKPNGRTRIKIRSELPQTNNLSAIFDLTGGGSVVSGTGAITALPDGWYRCTATSIGNGNGVSGYHLIQPLGPGDAETYLGDGVSGFYIWGAQLEYGTSATTYQRANTATDYADVGAPRRLKFDGIDDFLVTNSIDFTGTDKMTAWVGVRKLSDAALGCLVELSATAATNNGSFVIYAPRAAGNYASSLRGTTVAGLVVATYAAPISNVLSFKYDIGATGYLAEIVPRVNAATPAIANIDGADAGTGNYGNYPVYIGRRGGTSLPFNGELYSPIVIRGAASTDAQIQLVERVINKNMGGVY